MKSIQKRSNQSKILNKMNFDPTQIYLEICTMYILTRGRLQIISYDTIYFIVP